MELVVSFATLVVVVLLILAPRIKAKELTDMVDKSNHIQDRIKTKRSKATQQVTSLLPDDRALWWHRHNPHNHNPHSHNPHGHFSSKDDLKAAVDKVVAGLWGGDDISLWDVSGVDSM